MRTPHCRVLGSVPEGCNIRLTQSPPFFTDASGYFLLFSFITVCIYNIKNVYFKTVVGSRVSSVGIATRYGLDGPGIEFR